MRNSLWLRIPFFSSIREGRKSALEAALVICVSIFASPQVSGATPTGQDTSIFSTPYVEEGDSLAPPKYLFHWSSAQYVLAAADIYEQYGEFPMSTIQPKQPLGLKFPELVGHEALYTWSHPTAAMAVSDREVYAVEYQLDYPNGPTAPPALLTMQISPRARVQVVTTFEGEGAARTHRDFSKVDLLMHVHKVFSYGQEKVLWREWVVLNPRVVKWFSLDPGSLPAEVVREIEDTATRQKSRLEPEEYFAADWTRWAYIFSYGSRKALGFLDETKHIPAALKRKCKLAVTPSGE